MSAFSHRKVSEVMNRIQQKFPCFFFGIVSSSYVKLKGIPRMVSPIFMTFAKLYYQKIYEFMATTESNFHAYGCGRQIPVEIGIFLHTIACFLDF